MEGALPLRRHSAVERPATPTPGAGAGADAPAAPVRTVVWVPTPWEQVRGLSPRALLCIGAIGATAVGATMASLCITDRICEKHDASEILGMTLVTSLSSFLGGAFTAGAASLLNWGGDWARWAVQRIQIGRLVAHGSTPEGQLRLIVTAACGRRLNWAGLRHALELMRTIQAAHPDAITPRRLAEAAAALVPLATGDSDAMIGRVGRFIEDLYAGSDLPEEVRNMLQLQLGLSLAVEPD